MKWALTYRTVVVSVMLASCAVMDVRAQWTADTARIGQLLRMAEADFRNWQMDSMAAHSERASTYAEELIARKLSTEERRIALRMKARSLDLIGRSGTGAAELKSLIEAKELMQDLGDEKAVAHMDEGIASWYDRNGKYAESIRHYRTILAWYKAQGDEQSAAEVLNVMGVVYRKSGAYGAAIECHLEALPVFERGGDPAEIAWTNIVIGAVYRAQREPRKSLAYFEKARALYERSGIAPGLAGAYNDLGSAYGAVGDPDSSLYWHRRAAELRRRNGLHNGVGDSYNYIGAILRERGDADIALAYFDTALAAYARVPNRQGVASVYGSMAEVEYARGAFAVALAYYDSSLVSIAGNNWPMEQADLLYRKARVHEGSGDPGAALSTYRAAIERALSANYYPLVMHCQKAAIALYERSGDLRSAYYAHRAFLVAKDSTSRRARTDEVTRHALRYELEQDNMRRQVEDEAQLRAGEADLATEQRQKYVYIAGGSLFGLLAIGLIGRLRFTARARRRMEHQQKELRRAKARAIRGERFKEQFLANMSHEIRTPMNAIMGMTGILQRNDHLPAQQAQLDAIGRNADNLLRLLNDILDLSKLDAGRLELELAPMSVREVLDQVEATMGARAQAKGLRMNFTCDEQVPEWIIGDDARIRQVLGNLLDNAIKFTDAGEVNVQVGTVNRDAEKEAVLVILISDTGVGIPADRVDRIFEEFTKAYSDERHKHGGTGLGLALCKRLVELHGGTIVVKSAEGVGSSFTIAIPFEIAPVHPAGKHSPTSDQSTALRDLRILVADDNEFNIMVAQDELRDAIPGVHVDVVVNGIEAVALARTNTYDAILMDVQMPELNGYDATRAIRKLDGAKASVPILAMSANVMKADLDRCTEAGMNGYVPKPFKREELMSALQRVIAGTKA